MNLKKSEVLRTNSAELLRSNAVDTLEGLIALLQEIKEEYKNETLYINDGNLRVRVLERTLTDNSLVHDVKIS